MSLPVIGDQVGRYTVLGELGAGAMGSVFLASDPQLDRRIAVKVLTRAASDGRLLDEARALAKLQHPNVVAVHDVGRWNDNIYIAMEYVEGVSLEHWLTSHADWRERLAAYCEAARGLAAAHKAGVVHHDVKPSNIMVGNDGRVRLVDFGLARSSPVLAKGSPGGTPRYMSPEQFTGVAGDARSDQFSLCVALHEALFHRHPFPGETAEARLFAATEGRLDAPVPGDVPASVVAAIVAGLAAKPEDRHPSVDAMLGALELPAHKSRWPWLVAGGGVVAAAGGIAAAFAFASSTPEPAPDPRAELLAASHLRDELHTPIAGDPLGVTIHRLSNGLTVYLSPNHERPRVHAIWRFRGGYADAPGVAGLALALAQTGSERIGTIDYAAEKPHLDRIAALYGERAGTTDTAARSRLDAEIDRETTAASAYEVPDEYATVLRELGASMKGGQLPDALVQELDLPSNRLDAWADLEADRLGHAVYRLFRPKLADKLADARRNEQDPRIQTLDAVARAVYAAHPFGATTHEFVAALEREPYAEAVRFAREHFIPNNAVLFLAGDLDPATTIPILERAFAHWDPKPVPAHITTPPPVTERSAVVESPAGSGVGYWWRVDDTTIANALSVLLNRLRHDVHDEPGEIDFAAYPGGILGVKLLGPSSDDAARTLEKIVDRARRGDFSDAMFTAIMANIRENRLLQLHDKNARAYRMAGFSTDDTPWHGDPGLRFDKLTHDDLVHAARDLLGAPHITTWFKPGGVAPSTPATSRALPSLTFPPVRSQAAIAFAAREHSPIQPKFLLGKNDIEKRVTPAGTLIAVADRRSEIFALRIRFDAGYHDLAELCVAINANIGGRALNDHGWEHAISGSDRCEATSLDITLWGLDGELPAIARQLEHYLGEPSAPDWERAKQSQLRWIESYTHELGGLMTTAAAFAHEGPRAISLELTDLPALRASSLATAVKSLAGLRRAPRTIVYVGRRSIDDVAALLPPIGNYAPLPHRPLPPVVAAPRVVVTAAPSVARDATTKVIFDLEIAERDRAVVNAFDRLWQAKPLAAKLDTASLGVAYPDPRAHTATWIAVDIRGTPAQTAAAVRHAIDDVLTTRFSSAEVDRAKTRLDDDLRSDWLGLDLVGWATNTKNVTPDLTLALLDWHDRGLAGDPRVAYTERVASLTPADIERLQARLARAPRRIVIVGNVDGIDRTALRALGTVVEVTPEQLIAPAPVRGKRR